MEDQTIAAVINGLSAAHWNLNLSQFCAVLGWREDEYAESKFRMFSELARTLSAFDNTAIAKLVRAGMGAGVIQT